MPMLNSTFLQCIKSNFHRPINHPSSPSQKYNGLNTLLSTDFIFVLNLLIIYANVHRYTHGLSVSCYQRYNKTQFTILISTPILSPFLLRRPLQVHEHILEWRQLIITLEHGSKSGIHSGIHVIIREIKSIVVGTSPVFPFGLALNFARELR